MTSRYLRVSASFVASLFLLVAISSCTKKTDENVTTDFNAKKTSAQTLVTEITGQMPKMNEDHAKWTSDLNAAAAKKNADTSRAQALRDDLKRHDDNGKKVMALIDSVKLYMTDNAADMKAQTDRLSANFDDLNSSWKSFLDEHAKLQGDITSYVAMTAGDAKLPADTSKTVGESIKQTAKKVGDAVTGKSSSDKHETVKHSTGGVPKNSSGTSGTSSTTTTTTTTTGEKHETVKHSTGGVPKNSSGTTTK